MKKSALLIFILVFAVVLLSIVKTFVSNNVSTAGVVLGDTQEKLSTLKTQNAILSQKLYEISSLTSISQRAKDLGYVDGKTSYVLNSKLPIAAKPWFGDINYVYL